VSKRLLTALLFAACGLLAYSAAHADIFRCVDRTGRSLFTDRPCPPGSRTVDVTTAAKICGSDDCLQRAERATAQAQERRRLELEQLAALSAEQERRMRAEQEVQRLAAELSARDAAVPDPVAAAEPYIAPGYVIYLPPGTCVGSGCYRPPHRPEQHPVARKPGPSNNGHDAPPRAGGGRPNSG
jgi:hypothetical protein